MKKTLLFILTITALISLSGCGILGQSKNSSNTESFSKNSLKVKNFDLKITKTAVIPAGTSGNEFGKRPIFAIWYTIKNTSNKEVSPVSAASVLRAYQPAQSKKQLVAAPLPDTKLASKYKIHIKKNHAAKGSMAWNLYDTKSSIKIHGVKYGTNHTIGVQTYSIK